MNFADRFPCENAHFNRANNFLSVARRDPIGGFAIQSVEEPMQMLGAARLNFCAKPFTEFFGSGGRIGESFQQSAEIKARARGEDGKFAAPSDIFEGIECVAAIFSGSENFLGFYQVNEVMRNSALIGGRNFSGPDIKMAVNLRGIADKNFAAELLGKFDSQRRFSGSSRPENYQEPREVAHPENFQYRNKRISKTTAANNRAPATCARFSLNAGPPVPA